MGSDRDISEAINKLVGTQRVDPMYYVNAEVVSVDIPARTCSCVVTEGLTELTLPNVKLMAVVDDGLLIEPKIGSAVKIIYSRDKESFVCQYSEIENITIDANTKIKLNDGSFGGLIKIESLTSKINALVSKVNELISTFNAHTHTYVNVSTPAITSVTATLVTTPASILNKTDYENTKITHGN